MVNKPLTSFSKTINGIQIYLEDLEFLISKFKAQGYIIKIQDKNAEYENLNDLLLNKGLFPKKIELTASIDNLNNIALDIESGNVTIYSWGSEINYGTGIELAAYFKNKIPWYYWITKSWVIWALGTAICIILTNNTFNITVKIILWIIFSFLCIAYFFSYTNYKIFNTVILKKRHEHGFWKENKDKIIIALIAAIISAILTLLIGELLKKT